MQSAMEMELARGAPLDKNAGVGASSGTVEGEDAAGEILLKRFFHPIKQSVAPPACRKNLDATPQFGFGDSSNIQVCRILAVYPIGNPQVGTRAHEL